MSARTNRVSLVAAIAATALVAACGSSTTTSTGTAPETDVTPETTAAPETITPETITPETTVAPETTTPESTVAPETTTAPETTAPETTAVSTTTTAPTTTSAPTPAVTVCPGSDAPAGEPATTSLLLDLRADGTADDLVEGFFTDAGWPRMRVTTAEGVYSEVIGVVDGNFRPLGTAPIFAGGPSELLAVIGEGDVATEVGVFTLDAGDCLTPYAIDGTDSGTFTGLVRPASPLRSGMICFDGGIGLYGAEQFDDGTWFAYGAAYEQRSATEMQYMPASDDYAEDLTEADLGTFEFDCFGLTL